MSSGATCGSWWAVTLVGVDQVDAASSVLTRVAVALLDLDVADGARVARLALAGEGGDAVFAHAVVARLRDAVVDVVLAKQTVETCGRTFSLRNVTKNYCVMDQVTIIIWDRIYYRIWGLK